MTRAILVLPRLDVVDRDTCRLVNKVHHESVALARAKTTLQAMIDGIRVHGRDNIEPTFRVPAVRIDYGYMGETARRANRGVVAAPALRIV